MIPQAFYMLCLIQIFVHQLKILFSMGLLELLCFDSEHNGNISKDKVIDMAFLMSGG